MAENPPPPKSQKNEPGRSDSGHGARSGDKKDVVYKKVFNDSVHGHIELHPLLVSIINTQEFQRMRFIKQLGMGYFVYPGASHNRFEHSVGVCYLSGKLARNLQREQDDLGISDKDVLCVEIAGLCHDLGHGPFSHLFDNMFIPGVTDSKMKHEELSVAMFDHILEKNDNVSQCFKKYELGDEDKAFIREQIAGPEKKGNYKGRKDKQFLYEIVANKRNGIDVDKWDYFARDSLHLGMDISFDWKRCLKLARVQEVEGELQICTRDKEVNNLYDMFHTRYMLHKRAYQHKVTKILELMMVEALKMANNDSLTFPGRGNYGKRTRRKMSGAFIHKDMEAYSKMTDHIMWTILESEKEELKSSKEMVERILERDLFPFIGETQVSSGGTPTGTSEISDRKKVAQEIHKLMDRKARDKVKSSDDILIHFVEFSYGKGNEDPIKYVKFYKKPKESNTDQTYDIIDGGDIAARDPMSRPSVFSVKFMRVCIRNKREEVKDVLDSVRVAFSEWCTKNNLTAEDDVTPCLITPPHPSEGSIHGRPQKRPRTPESPRREEPMEAKKALLQQKRGTE